MKRDNWCFTEDSNADKREEAKAEINSWDEERNGSWCEKKNHRNKREEKPEQQTEINTNLMKQIQNTLTITELSNLIQ